MYLRYWWIRTVTIASTTVKQSHLTIVIYYRIRQHPTSTSSTIMLYKYYSRSPEHSLRLVQQKVYQRPIGTIKHLRLEPPLYQRQQQPKSSLYYQTYHNGAQWIMQLMTKYPYNRRRSDVDDDHHHKTKNRHRHHPTKGQCTTVVPPIDQDETTR